MADIETEGDLKDFVKQIVEGAPLEIRSDGSPVNTHVTVDGKPLSCIQEMNIRFGADRLMTHVDLTIMAPKLRLKGKVAKVTIEVEDKGDAVDPGPLVDKIDVPAREPGPNANGDIIPDALP